MIQTSYRPTPRPTLDVQSTAETMISRYCAATGKSRAEVINRRTDRQTIALRDCLLYAAWKRVELSTQCKTAKIRVLAQVFEIRENTAFERLAKFESNLSLYHSDLSQYEEVSALCQSRAEGV